MSQAQDRSLNLLASIPVRYHWTTATSCDGDGGDVCSSGGYDDGDDDDDDSMITYSNVNVQLDKITSSDK